MVYFVATTPDLSQIAVFDSNTGWQLPRCNGLTRLPPADGARTRPPIAARINPADIVHWAPLPPRGDDDGLEDWYCVAVTADIVPHHDARPGSECVLVDRHRLLSGDALDDQEQLAVHIALSRLETPTAMFDAPDEVHAAIAWAEHEIVNKTGAAAAAITRYRNHRHDLVVRFETFTDAMYLKAGRQRFADEAILTQHLHALLPTRIPETLAVDRRTHRWLYRELPGTPLAATRLNRHTIVAAVRALVSLQRATIGSKDIARHVGTRRQTAVELFHAVDTLIEPLRRVPSSDQGLPAASIWDTLRDPMIRTCAAVDELSMPSVLVPSDFWAQNILVMRDGIGFIDLGHSYWTIPVLPLWRFVRDLKRRWPASDPVCFATIRHDIGIAFLDAWASAVSPRLMTRALDRMWLIGRLFGLQIASCDLDLLEQSLGTTLPHSYRAARLEARVREIVRAVAQHVVMPRQTESQLATALDL